MGVLARQCGYSVPETSTYPHAQEWDYFPGPKRVGQALIDVMEGEHVIKLPDVGEGVAEAELVEWHVKIGDLAREEADGSRSMRWDFLIVGAIVLCTGCATKPPPVWRLLVPTISAQAMLSMPILLNFEV